jgi:structure-specific recognition protein 1
VPRGRFAIEFYPAFLRLLGSSYEFKVAYKSIARITYLPLPASSGSYMDATRFALVISLIDPLRQGVQRHPHLVLQLDKKPVTVPLAIPEEDRAAGRYEGRGGGGETSISGDLPKLVGSLFKKLTGKPVYKCESFESGGGEKQRGVRCNYKSSPGVLFPLEKSVIFIHKPTLLIMYSDVEKITATMSSMNTLFDLSVQCRAVGGEGRKEYVFGQLDKKEYGALTKFFGDKGVKVVEVKSAVAQAGYVDMKQLDDAIAGEDEGDDDDDEDASIKFVLKWISVVPSFPFYSHIMHTHALTLTHTTVHTTVLVNFISNTTTGMKMTRTRTRRRRTQTRGKGEAQRRARKRVGMTLTMRAL